MTETIEYPSHGDCPLVGSTAGEDCAQIPDLYLRAFVDSYSSGIAVLDQTGTIIYVNRSWREFAVEHHLASDLYGIGCNYLEVRRQALDAPSRESATIADGVEEVLLGRRTEFQNEYLSSNSISRRWIRIHAGRFDLPRACRVLITQEDVTEDRQIIAGHQKEAERLQQLLHVTHILPWEADPATASFTYVGEQAVNMLGYPLEDWYTPDFWSTHLHPDDRDWVMARYFEYANIRDDYEMEYRMQASDGRIIWLHNLISVIREGDHVKAVRGFSIDVTESKENLAALRHVSGRLINAQEEERRRVARELHDDLNQRMALLSIALEQMGQIESSAELHCRLNSLQRDAQEISADIHRLSYRLHPSKLDHLGLDAAMKSLCQELSGKWKLKVIFQPSGFPADLPKDITLCVFRIAQEALRNCVKHSGAEVARVVLENDGDEIWLSISDDGCGFDMDSAVMEQGLGFTSMRERLRIVGGTLQIYSQPMHGTAIEVSVPLAREVETMAGTQEGGERYRTMALSG
jgi:PAS domain S-box-containing protein